MFLRIFASFPHTPLGSDNPSKNWNLFIALTKKSYLFQQPQIFIQFSKHIDHRVTKLGMLGALGEVVGFISIVCISEDFQRVFIIFIQPIHDERNKPPNCDWYNFGGKWYTECPTTRIFAIFYGNYLTYYTCYINFSKNFSLASNKKIDRLLKNWKKYVQNPVWDTYTAPNKYRVCKILWGGGSYISG